MRREKGTGEKGTSPPRLAIEGGSNGGLLVALLGQWEARALRMADRAEAALRAPAGPCEAAPPDLPILRRTAERIKRRDLADACLDRPVAP